MLFLKQTLFFFVCALNIHEMNILNKTLLSDPSHCFSYIFYGAVVTCSTKKCGISYTFLEFHQKNVEGSNQTH